MMQGSQNRDGWVSIEDEELQTANPPSHAKFELAGREAALAYAREEVSRLRIEVDEIAHLVEMGPNLQSEPAANRRLTYGALLLMVAVHLLAR
ncbi:hypothetical protein ASE04_18990 [Rhizobium sp. Root708]|uniref:hypothetical protein n=1 Tax=Rhizobium sp. Root708 TaxID=1736592 RepID=UPI0006F7772A|nr:hypothetical protein [Rhizobium sp. Root708]KRB49255.1 hypothetical protein ASE04_18990 [Rhizobium sp. Root708]